MKRVWISITLLLVLCACLAGITTVFAAETTFKGVTINVPGIKARPWEPWYNNAGEFEKRTGIKAVVHTFPHGQLYAKEISELVAGTKAFDLITGMQLSLAMFDPFVRPLDDFIKRDYGSIERFKAMFYPNTINECIYGGKIKYVPVHINSQFCVYRKDLFEDPKEKADFKATYGYELQPPKTVQQFIDIAKFFTRPEEDLWGLVFMGKSVPGGWTMVSTLFGAGLKLVDSATGTVPFKSGPARDKAIQAAKLWYDLIHTYKVAPSGSSAIGHTETYEMYVAGRAAMSYGWWGDFWDRVRSPEIIADIGETGSFSLPTLDPKEGIFMSMWPYGITKDSPNPEAAWEWIKMTLSKEMQLAASKNSGAGCPVKEYMKIAVEKGWVASANMETLSKAKQTPNLTQSYGISNLYWTYAPALYAGDFTPEEFVDFLVKKTKEIME